MKKTYTVSLTVELETDMTEEELRDRAVIAILDKSADDVLCDEKNGLSGHGIDIIEYTEVFVEDISEYRNN